MPDGLKYHHAPFPITNHEMKKCITRVRQFVAIAPIKSVKTKRGHWKFQCKLKMSTLHQRYDVLVSETFLGLVFLRGRERAAIMQEFAQTNFWRPAPASQPAKASSTSQPARFLETGPTSRNRPPGQTGSLTGIKIVNEMVVVSLAGFACRKVCAPETNSSGTCKCHDNANMFYVPLADWFPQKCGLTVKNGSQRKRLVNIYRSFHARQSPTKKTIVRDPHP